MSGFVGQPFGIAYEGLAELGRALREVDEQLLAELKGELFDVGEIVRDDAARLLLQRSPTSQKSARGLDTRSRLGGRSDFVLVVGQSLSKTTGRRPDWGAFQYNEALVPAYEQNEDLIVRTLEDGVVKTLREHGLAS